MTFTKPKAMKVLFLLTISFCLFNLACVQASVETVSSNTVRADQIFQIYTVEASKTRTEIVAAFRVGGATGTTLELVAPSKVLYNDAMIPVSAPNNLIGTNYRMKGTDYRTNFQQYNPSHKFSYTDRKGKTYTNSVKLVPIEITANGAVSFNNLKPTTIPLSRTIGNDETLTISLDSAIDDAVPTGDNSVYLNAKRNSVVVTPNYWKTKSLNSQAELKIKVKKTGNVSNGTQLGGSISAVYSAAPISVNVPSVKKTARRKRGK